MGGPAIGLSAGLTAGIAVGLTLGPAAGFMYSMTWVASLAFVQLAVRRRTPVRLVRFLEDARDRNVLRTVGPSLAARNAASWQAPRRMPPTTATPGAGATVGNHSRWLPRAGSRVLLRCGHPRHGEAGT